MPSDSYRRRTQARFNHLEGRCRCSLVALRIPGRREFFVFSRSGINNFTSRQGRIYRKANEARGLSFAQKGPPRATRSLFFSIGTTTGENSRLIFSKFSRICLVPCSFVFSRSSSLRISPRAKFVSILGYCFRNSITGGEQYEDKYIFATVTIFFRERIFKKENPLEVIRFARNRRNGRGVN